MGEGGGFRWGGGFSQVGGCSVGNGLGSGVGGGGVVPLGGVQWGVSVVWGEGSKGKAVGGAKGKTLEVGAQRSFFCILSLGLEMD